MLNYSVTPEDYEEMIRYELVKKKEKPLSKMDFWIGVGGPLILVFFLVAFDLKTWLKVVCCLGIAASIFTLFFRTHFLDTRTRIAMRQVRQNGAKYKDFWERHHLYVRNEYLYVEYGRNKLSIDCKNIEGIDNTGNLALIRQEDGFLDIIPYREVSESDLERTLNDIERARHAKENRDMAAHRQMTMPRAQYVQTVSMTREEVADKLVALKHYSYRSPYGWSITEVVLLLAALGVAIFCLSTRQLWPSVLAVVVFCLALYSALYVFLPAYRKETLRGIYEAGEDGYQLVLTPEKVYVYCRYRVISDLRTQLKKIVTLPDGTMGLFFAKRKMMFVPAEYAADFREALSRKPEEKAPRSISDKAKI